MLHIKTSAVNVGQQGYQKRQKVQDGLSKDTEDSEVETLDKEMT